MGAMVSQITSLTIVYSTVYSGADQRKHQSPASLAFVRGIHQWPVNSPHKWPVTRKMFPFDDIIMIDSANGLLPNRTEPLTELLINEILWHSPESNYTTSALATFLVIEITTISFRGQWVKGELWGVLVRSKFDICSDLAMAISWHTAFDIDRNTNKPLI